MVEIVNKLIRTSRQLVQELGREPRSEEIAKQMDIPVAKVRKVLKVRQAPISLETPIGEEGDSHLGEFIEDRAAISPAETVINVDLKDQTANLLRTLTLREEKVIKMRFGLEDGSEHTLEEVASIWRMRSRVTAKHWSSHFWQTFTNDTGICARWEWESRNAETACASFGVHQTCTLAWRRAERWRRVAGVDQLPDRAFQSHAILAPQTWSNEAVAIQGPDPNVAGDRSRCCGFALGGAIHAFTGVESCHL